MRMVAVAKIDVIYDDHYECHREQSNLFRDGSHERHWARSGS
jgi:hypothetical protein